MLTLDMEYISTNILLQLHNYRLLSISIRPGFGRRYIDLVHLWFLPYILGGDDDKLNHDKALLHATYISDVLYVVLYMIPCFDNVLQRLRVHLSVNERTHRRMKERGDILSWCMCCVSKLGWTSTVPCRRRVCICFLMMWRKWVYSM